MSNNSIADKPTQTMTAYMKTSQALWYWATIAIATISAAVVFAVPENLYPLSFLRIALGLLFILWLPGYTFIKAFFPKHEPTETTPKDLETIERTILSIGISLALVPMVGLLIYYTPWGLSLTPIVLSLLALMIFLATIAAARENKAQKEKKNDSA